MLFGSKTSNKFVVVHPSPSLLIEWFRGDTQRSEEWHGDSTKNINEQLTEVDAAKKVLFARLED